MDKKTAIRHFKILSKKGVKMRLAAEDWNSPWKTLIAIILSARTRDEKTIRVSELLFSKYNTLKKLAYADIKNLEATIRSINFYKNKSRAVSSCAKVLVEKYKGKVPRKIEELIKLPGVGRKTANVFLSEYGHDALGVDTHVFYISRYLGWSKNKNPHKVEEDLKRLFPKSYWRKINPILVRFGKTYTSRREKNKILDEIK